jgi:hypothetical protein
MVLKETIAYYVQKDSMAYCTMLDATKAFDRVQYCKLFRLLVDTLAGMMAARPIVDCQSCAVI